MSSAANTTTQYESPYAMALANISADKWNNYKQTFVPVENQYMGRVDQLNGAEQYAQVGGLAQSGVMQQYQPMLDQAQAQLEQSGAAPGSGVFTQNMAKARTTGATAAAQATFGAQQGQQDAYRAGLESVVGIGNGQSALAQGSMANLAQQSVDAAKQQTALDWGSKAALVRGVGTAGGLLAGAGLSSLNSK